MTELRECVICKKEIEVYKENTPNGHTRLEHNHSTPYLFSKEGVFFAPYTKWFCIDCWKKILKYYREVKRINVHFGKYE